VKPWRQGGYRYVYREGGYVRKVARRDVRDSADHNRNEWRIWCEFPDLRSWLAPCIWMSDDGCVLLQVRGIAAESVPSAYPDVLADARKLNNWVLIDGTPRLCDYGHERMIQKLEAQRGRFAVSTQLTRREYRKLYGPTGAG